MSLASSLERLSQGQSVLGRRVASVAFLVARAVAPGLFVAFAWFGPGEKPAFLLAVVFSVGWLLVAYDLRNFAHGRRVFLDPLFLDSTPANTEARCIAVAFNLAFAVYIIYATGRTLVS